MPRCTRTKKATPALWNEGAHRRRCRLGLVHSLHTTAANESDVAHAHDVLHGQERQASPGRGLHIAAKREEVPGVGPRQDPQRHSMECGPAAQHDHPDASSWPSQDADAGLERVKGQMLPRGWNTCSMKNLFGHKDAQGLGQEQGPVVQPVRAGQPLCWPRSG